MAFQFDKSYEEYKKKRQQEEREAQLQEKKQNIDYYTNAKRTSMQENFNTIKEKNKKQEARNQAIREELNKINDDFKKQNPVTVTTNVNTNTQLPKAQFKISNSKEKLKTLDSKALFELTKGKIDQRSPGQKTLSDMGAVVGNIAMGVESVVPSATKYVDKLNNFLAEKIGARITSDVVKGITKNNQAGNIAGDIIGKRLGNSIYKQTELSKINKQLNNEKIQNWRDKTIQGNINQTSNPLARKLAEISPSLGQNAVPMAVSAVNPLLGTAMFITSAGGSYLKQAEEMGMSDEQQLAYATIMAGVEGGSESFISAKFINDAVKKVGLKGLSNEILHSTGVNIGENFLQEWATEYIDEYAKSLASIESKEDIATALKGQGKYANWEGIHARAMQSGIDGIISATILDGATLGVASAQDVVQGKSNDIQQAFKDSQKVVDMDKIKDGVGKAVQENMKKELTQQMLPTNQQNTAQNENILPIQQTTSEQNKMAENGNTEQNNNQLVPFSIKETDDLITSAKKYRLNYNDESIQTLQEALDKRGVNGQFNGEYFKNTDGSIDTNTGALWNITTDENGNKTRSIILNPNASEDTVIQEAGIHELLHDIISGDTKQSKQVYDRLLKYMEKDSNYKTKREQLENIYAQKYDRNSADFQQMIDEEVVAKALQTKFGNQEEINRLIKYEPTGARNLYDKVVSKVNELFQKYNGDSKLLNKAKDYLFWKDIQNKFEYAYSQEGNYNNLKDDSKYFIETVEEFSKMKYNNATDISEQINYKERGILRHMIADDSNVKPGLNRIYTTNAEYLVYLEDKNHYKILSRKVDSDAGKLTERNPYTGRMQDGSSISRRSINDTTATKSNDGISNFDSTGESERVRNNRSSQRNNENVKNSNKSSFSMDNKGRKLTKEQQEYFKDSKILDRNGLLLTLYHGTNNDFNIFDKNYVSKNTKNAGFYGDGFYFTPDKESAKQYGKNSKEVYLDIKNPFSFSELSKVNGEDYYSDYVQIMNLVELNSEWGNIPVKFADKNTWQDINNDVKKMLKENKTDEEIDNFMYDKYGEITERINDRLYNYAKRNNYKTLSQILEEKGYDGIINSEIPENSTEIVAFNSNQIKNVDNINPTENPDIRYSNETNFDKYLENKIGKKGTRTKIQDIKLPTKQEANLPTAEKKKVLMPTKETKKSNEGIDNTKEETNFEKYNRYKKNILDRRTKEVNGLISFKNDSIRNIDAKIQEKEAIINSKQNKDTKAVALLRSQIENLKTRRTKLDNLYNEKIDKVNAKTNKEKIDFETRNTIKQEARKILQDEISPLTKDLSKYKDKRNGFLLNRETAQRNIYDVVQDKELADQINETIFNPIQKDQAQKTREINELFGKINELNLDKTKKYEYHPSEDTISGKITDKKKTIKIDEATLAQLLIEKKLTDNDLKNTYNLSNEQIEKVHKASNLFSDILNYLYEQMNEKQIQYGYSPIGKRNNYFPHFFENKPDTMLGKVASYFGIDVTKQELPTEIAGKTDIFKPGKTYNSNTLERKTNKTDYDALKAMEKYIVGATDIIYTTDSIQKLREFERQIRYQYSDKGIQENIDNILNNNSLTQEAKDSAISGIFNNTEHELSNFVTWLNDYTNILANKKSFADRNMEHEIGRNLYSSMSGVESRIASNTIGGNLSVSITNFAPLFQSMGTTKPSYVLTGMLQTTANNIKGFRGEKDTSFVNNSNFLTNRFGTKHIAERTTTQKLSDYASIPMNAIDEFTSESIVRAKYLENIDKGMTEEQALDNADKYTAKIMADRSKGALPIIFNKKNPLSKLVTMFQVEPNNIISNYFKDMPREAGSKKQLATQYTKLMISSYAFNTLAMAIRGGNEVLPDPIRWVSYLIKSIFGDDDKDKEQAKKDLSEAVIGSIPFVSNAAGMLGLEDVGRIPISNALPNVSNIAKTFDSEKDSKYRKELAIKELSKPLLYLGLPTGGAQINKTVQGIKTINEGGSYKTNSKGEEELQFPVENPTAKDYIKASVFGKYSLPLAKEYTNNNFKSLNAKQTKTYKESNIPYKEYLEYLKQGLKTNKDKIDYISNQDWGENQKWGIYINEIFSNTERNDGGSQLKDAQYIISDGVSKTEYMQQYNKAFANDVKMPTTSQYIKAKVNGISLSEYINNAINNKKK